MAKKKKVAGSGAKGKPEPKKKEDPSVIFESWLKSCTEEQRNTISEVDTHLGEIQTDKKNLRRELQPLRVGMELDKVRLAITGEEGAASPQKETGRIWGAYRDSHLKDAGYSKASCDRYVGMIAAARTILPDDPLIVALLDYANDKGVVQLVGGNVKKPFGKYTMYLQSKDVQMHVKDGKVNLDDLSADDLIANVFDPLNAEAPDTLPNMSVAVNGVVSRILTQVKGELKPGKDPLDLSKVVENARDYVRYVIECLLTVCNCPDMKDTFEPNGEDIIEADKLLTLEAAVKKANDDKQNASAAKPTKKQKQKKEAHVRHADDKVADIVMGKYTIRKNKKAQHFPLTPWEIFENGNDKPVARAQDRLQAQQEVEKLLAKQSADNLHDLADAAKTQKGAHSDSPSSPAAQQDEEIRKQREARGEKQYDAG